MKFLKQIASVLFIVSVHFCIPVDVHGSSSDKPDVFVQIDHPGIVTQAALSPDGNLALSISRNNLKIWDVKSGREIRTMYEPDFMGFQSIAVLPDGKHVLTNGLKLWDITTGEKVRSFGSLTGPICLTPDGKTVAGVVWPNEIELWDISTEKLIRKFTQHRLRVNSISISPDGRRVVSGSEDNTIKIWDIPSGSLIRSIF